MVDLPILQDLPVVTESLHKKSSKKLLVSLGVIICSIIHHSLTITHSPSLTHHHSLTITHSPSLTHHHSPSSHTPSSHTPSSHTIHLIAIIIKHITGPAETTHRSDMDESTDLLLRVVGTRKH